MINAIRASVPEIHVLIVGTSLNPNSRSSIMGQFAAERLQARGIATEALELRELKLPFVGDGESDHSADVDRVKAAFKRATHIILAVPIYNGDVNAAARNLANLGCDFNNKTVAFLCAAGGARSYLSVLSFANSLMFEFEAWIVPRYVYATASDFNGGTLSNPEILNRINSMLEALLSRAPGHVAQLQSIS